MLSCLIKLERLRCVKYLGSTVSQKDRVLRISSFMPSSLHPVASALASSETISKVAGTKGKRSPPTRARFTPSQGPGDTLPDALVVCSGRLGMGDDIAKAGETASLELPR